MTGSKTMSRTVLASSAGERTGPEISKLNPDTGQVGDSVKIKGSNFGALRGASTVTFNGTAVTDYVSWGETKIQVRVPEGATTGPVVVTVDGEASSGVTFTVTGPAPAINANGLSPDSGPVGTSVKVKGLNFGASQGESTVTFNGTSATPTSWSDTKIQVPVPVGVTTGPVVVTVDGQASNGVTFTVVTTPTIDEEGLNPDTGQVGDSVKIKGSNFGALRGTSTVTFNGTAVTDYVSWDDTKIQVRVPEGATTGPVVVTVDGEASSGVAFTVTGPAPAINDNGLSPDSGPVGTSVKVKGLNFGASQGDSTVTFNGVAAEPTSWSDTKIQVRGSGGGDDGPGSGDGERTGEQWRDLHRGSSTTADAGHRPVERVGTFRDGDADGERAGRVRAGCGLGGDAKPHGDGGGGDRLQRGVADDPGGRDLGDGDADSDRRCGL